MIKKEVSEREQWFFDRIGKTVYRNDNKCSCNKCKEVTECGLEIYDKMHAGYLYDMEGTSNYEGIPLKYFDTIKERNEFEISSKQEGVTES